MNESILFEKEARRFLCNLRQQFPDIWLLCDTHTRQYCLPAFEQLFGETDPERLLCMPAGENAKSIATAVALWTQLKKHNARRDSLLLNLGGGVVCDTGAFVAATWKRGMPFIHIPTTLMAQADAAIGGKCALNFENAKNQIGLFRPAEAVCILPEWLRTLPPEELRSGYAEMLKHGILADAEHFRELCKTAADTPPSMEQLRRTISIKLRFAAPDREERRLRKALNFGHSIGHVLEALSQGGLRHGEAVAQGMRAEALIARKTGLLPAADFEEINRKLRRLYGPFPRLSCSDAQALELLAADKKRDASSGNFSLPSGIGSVRVNQNVPAALVLQALRALSGESAEV
ncbi:MAG: 3-dehydroquinate synthase [Bacteroidales bacterium]|nr:3-dehydroquinate synthase [Bacteroidales bacterium]